MKDVAGKTAFITGGASGIGLGIAEAFVRAGMRVVLADIRADHLAAAKTKFEELQAGDKVHCIQLDVTDREGWVKAADEAERVFGPVAVLCNNAGVGLEGPLEKATYDDWDFGLGVNLGGVVNGIQTFMPRMRARGEGHIVNTASLAGMVVMPAYMAIYAAGKAAVIALSESIRTELAPAGVGVSVLCPGPVKTNIHQAATNRPERFRKASGFSESEERLSRRQVSDLWMEPIEAGEMVLNAVRNDALYVITHGEWADSVRGRAEAMVAAMPPPNEALLASFSASLKAPDEKPES
jgi:NAD(P)-dependent dehydrogenase (short-subunit alcohol dehydrogenase family)